MKPIGIYVHNHSDGHRQRAIAIAQQAPDYFTLLGSGLKGRTGTLSIVDLPDVAMPQSVGTTGRQQQGNTAFSSLWGSASANHKNIRRRTRLIADWIETAEPALLLVDASVEIAMLAILTSTPVAYMRLSGNRTDPAHIQIFNAAAAIMCPFHKVLESGKTPQWLCNRSHYFPGLTNIARIVNQPQRTLLIILGKGQNNITATQFSTVADALPDWQINVIGQLPPPEIRAENLHFHGRVDNPEYFIAHASVVAGAASDCLITAVSAGGKPFICLPQIRPSDAHYEKAARLETLRAAVVCRKWPANWQKTITAALRHGAAMAALHDTHGAARAAELLLDIACGTQALHANSGRCRGPVKLASG